MTGSDTSPPAPSAPAAPPAPAPGFRLAYVPGVTPGKWVRIWNERLPEIPLTLLQVPAAEACGLMAGGDADAGIVRLPVDRDVFSAIPLYTETTVVVIPKDHLLAAADEVSTGDLADEIVLHPMDDTLDWESLPGRPAIERPATTADAIELVAAGIGVLVVPQSLARLHHRRDLTYRPVADAPESRVALSWPEDRTTDPVEHFIGIVRGRTVNSTRGPQAPGDQPKSRPAPDRKSGKTPAKGKTAGKPTGKSTGKSTGKPAGKNPRAGGAAPKAAKGRKPRRRP
ncbi:LysR substrate-binding domain-containing protein [Streptomyces sp. NPDC048603]|uniref:LysR substrate-binding domain-containing protein n=1 Tax=Streptomyces sp. NPDC048603 TaxID=3365577 RepID=UPI003719A512